MLSSKAHPMWKETIAAQALEKALPHLRHELMQSLKQMSLNLSRLIVMLRTLKTGETLRGGSFPAVGRLQSQSKRVASDATEGLPELVQSLRNCNDLFCTLTRRCTPDGSRHIDVSSLVALSRQDSTRGLNTSYSHISCIQYASRVLYTTITTIWTCRDHDSHSLSISLNPNNTPAKWQLSSSKIQFNLAMTAPFLSGSYRIDVTIAPGKLCDCQTTQRGQTFNCHAKCSPARSVINASSSV